MLEFLGFGTRLNLLRQKQKQLFAEHKYTLYYANIPDAVKVYDFEKKYKKIPAEYILDAWTSIYSRLNYGFSVWNPEVLSYVFQAAKKRNKNSSSKMITVYRGEGTKSTPIDKAYSWTTNINVALAFACHGEGQCVWKAEVPESCIITTIQERGEDEVILEPKSVKDKKKMDILPERQDVLLSLIDEVYDEYIDYGNSILKLYDTKENVHGFSHTARVLLLTLLLANALNLPKHINKMSAVAAVFHDIGRTNDDESPEHGFISAQKFLENDSVFSENERKIISVVITYHSLPDAEGENYINENFTDTDAEQALLLYKILKDADALDRYSLGRYHSEFDYNYLRLDASKKLPMVAAEFYKRKAEGLLKQSITRV